MRGMAVMRRRITLGEWTGPGWASRNVGHVPGAGYVASILFDGNDIGQARNGEGGYSFELGEYPNEQYHGDYRTENAMLNAVAMQLIDR